MRIYYFLNRVLNAVLLGIVFCCVFYAISELLSLIAGAVSSSIISLDAVSSFLDDCAPYFISYFLAFSFTYGSRGVKSFWCCICLYAFLALSGTQNNFIFAFLIPFFVIFCFKNFSGVFSYAVSLSAVVIFGVSYSFINDFFANALMNIAKAISDKGVLSSALFGLINTFLSSFKIDEFAALFYEKSYGGTTVYGQDVITGAIELFKIDYDFSGVSAYLSGHYLQLFLLFGVFLYLVGEIKKTQKIALIASFAAVILSGNISAFMLVLFFESPFIFFAVCIFSTVCYAGAYITDLQMGFILNGSVFEMLKYLKNPVYLVALGVVFAALGYFTAKYLNRKYAISDCENIYYPTRLQKIVDALGGIKNIVRFRDDCLEVRNPGLVDTLLLSCSISENMIKSEEPMFNELREYIT